MRRLLVLLVVLVPVNVVLGVVNGVRFAETGRALNLVAAVTAGVAAVVAGLIVVVLPRTSA